MSAMTNQAYNTNRPIIYSARFQQGIPYRSRFMTPTQADIKAQRLHQVHRNIFLLLFGLTLIIFLCVFTTSITSSARSIDREIYKYYETVQVCYGDTLWSITKERFDATQDQTFSEYLSEVQQINHLDSTSTLLTGQYLILPYYSTELH